MKTKTIIGMMLMLMALVGMTACDKEHEDNPANNPEVYKGHKMLVNGRTWNYVFLYKEGETIDTVYSSITIEGPVEFEGRQCYKVVPTSIEEPQVFFYEEGSKVYIYDMDYGDFEHGYPFVWKEAFDFNLTVGERAVTAVDTISVNGEYYRRLTLGHDIWVEGIGSREYGIVTSWGFVPGSFRDAWVISVYDGDKCIFTAEDFTKPSITQEVRNESF